MTPDPFHPLWLPSGYLLDGGYIQPLHVPPLLNEKPVTKWRRRALARPHFEELTQDSGKKCASLCVWFFKTVLLFFANKQTAAHTRVHLTPCLDSTTPSTELWANESVLR